MFLRTRLRSKEAPAATASELGFDGHARWPGQAEVRHTTVEQVEASPLGQGGAG